jgi:hypothetical protein
MSGSRDGARPPARSADSAEPIQAEPIQAGPSLPDTLPEPITVVLVVKAADDLQLTHERTNLSKTDIVNRAVSLYEFVDAELTAGAELIVRRDGEEYLVKLM